MKTKILAFLFAIFCLDTAESHSYLTKPTSRTNQAQTQTGCRGPQCLGPCDAQRDRPGNTAPVAIERGADLELLWPRNNHAGGFIRIAWAPTEESDQHESFDKHVQLFTCHEITCQSSNFPADPLGGDSDGQALGKCSASLTVPQQLSDGNWTMQWSWFGGAFQLGDYYSCVDYEIRGGGPASALSGLRVDFIGGDVHNNRQNDSSDKCLFFNTNKLRVCSNEPCTNGNLPGQNNGYPDGIQSANTRNRPTDPSNDTASTTNAAPTVRKISDTETVDFKQIFNVTTGTIAGIDGFGNITVIYTETFSSDDTFGGVLRLENRGLTNETGWSVTLSFPGAGKRLTESFGAELQTELNDNGGIMHIIHSNSTLLVGDAINVGLLGSYE